MSQDPARYHPAMHAFVTRHERLSIGLVLLLGLLIRLPAVPFDLRAVHDVRWFMEWARTIHDAGFVTVSEHIQDGVGLYPPLSLWLLGALATLESLVPASLRGGDGLLISLVKLLPVIADLALAILIAWLVRPRGAVVSMVGAAAIALNPAFIYVGGAWGQIDSMYALFLVATTALLVRSRFAGAWATWALAALVKVQGLLLAPLLLVVSVREGGWRRSITGMVVAVGIGILLFLPWLSGGLPRYLETMTRVDAHTTTNALNLWYVIGLGRRPSDLHRIIGPITPRLVGYGLVLLVAAFVAVTAWYRRAQVGLALPAAVLGMAPFMVLTGMRGRYLLVVLPFLVLLALGWDRRGVLPRAGLLAVAVTTTLTINLIAFLPPDPSLWARFTEAGASGPLQPLVGGLALGSAAANVVVFAWLLISLARAAWRAGPVQGPPLNASGDTIDG